MQSGQMGIPERSYKADYAVGSKEPVQKVESTSIPQPVILSRPPLGAPGGAAGKASFSGEPSMPAPRPSGASNTSSGSSPEPGGGSETLDSRAPTLTQRMRSVQPPDVARQAMSELGVLARELGNLPDALEAAGLAQTHRNTYFEATHAYLTLAQQAWEAVSEERLEQSGAEPEYRQRAINVARRITQLQQEARTASGNMVFTLPHKTSVLWRRRTMLVRDGLRVWQDRLDSPPNASDMGHGLFLLRGFVGLAAAGSLWLGLLDLLVGATLATLSLLGAGLIALFAAAIISGSTFDITRFSAGILATALLFVLVLLLTVNGPLPLGLLLGASVFSPTQTTRNRNSGSPVMAGILKVWWLVVGLLTLPALLVALVLGGLLVRTQVALAAPDSIHQGLVLSGAALALGVVIAVAVCLVLLFLLALPVLLVSGFRGTAEMAGSPSWVPLARHYAVLPALVVETMLTSALVVTTWIVTTVFGLENILLVTLPVGTPTISISLRSVALVLALVLPYVLLLDLPYRAGMRGWQRSWVGDLTTRRADVESHIRRLSVTDPRSGVQDTSEENLRAMQYDLVLLQFYQNKIEEAQKARYAPVSIGNVYFAFLIMLFAALLLDVGATLLVRLFPLMGG